MIGRRMLKWTVPGVLAGVLFSVAAEAVFYLPGAPTPGIRYPDRGWYKGAHQQTLTYQVDPIVPTTNYKGVVVRDTIADSISRWNTALKRYSGITSADGWAVSPLALGSFQSGYPVGRLTYVNNNSFPTCGGAGTCNFRWYTGSCVLDPPTDGYDICKSSVGLGAVSAQNSSAFTYNQSVGANSHELGHVYDIPEVAPGNCDTIMSDCYGSLLGPQQGDVHRFNLIHGLPDAATLYYPYQNNGNVALFCFNDNSLFETGNTVELQRSTSSSGPWTTVNVRNPGVGSNPTPTASNDYKVIICSTWDHIRTTWGTAYYRARVEVHQSISGEAAFDVDWQYSNAKYVEDLP